jgi:hypothetical protein
MSTIETLEDRANILTTSLDVVLTYIHKYSENFVVSGAVSRLYSGVQESFDENYRIARAQIELLHYDPALKAHLLLIWGYTPEPARIISAAYYLFRTGEDGPFTRFRCVKSIGVKS